MPVLTLLWAVPAVGALLVAALPARAPAVSRFVALGVALVTLVVAVGVAVDFDRTGDRYQELETHRWIPALGAGYRLGVDGIAVALILLTAVLVPVLLVAAWRDTDGRRMRVYLALFLATEALVMVSFTALDILLFYVVFEAMLIPMYFLIGTGGGPDRARAAVKFLLYNLLGGLVMLAAVIGLYVATARDLGAGTFDFPRVVTAVADGSLNLDPTVSKALFLGFMFAFAVKAPMWPLHTWLPGAATEATPAVAVLMMAVVDKVGTFAMLRFCLQLFPDAARFFTPAILVLTVIGIIYGALVAVAQTDMMRLIAYTSISHFGFIILGIFALTSQGQAGSTLYMVNHGISTAALMLVAGFLVSRRGSKTIGDYGGVARSAPKLAGVFLIAGLATLSLPGLAPFISEFLVLIGTFTRYPVAAVCAAIALILAAVYVLWLYQRVMTGPTNPQTARIRDLGGRELLVVTPLVVLLIGLGVYPKPILDVVNPAVGHTLSTIEQHDPAPAVAENEGAR
ncbi:NADH-quinone oxidoreductase subunit M [Williamsia sterculiae]|uniref:NADH dehydrogenase subunit M n=1 Tax=Williamsia sterculiae TaxID=1344003 RepID=A0A1N7F7Y7_9NOCA|nr:NADH-quinone oxidoreductase subunit M [Williamsia sterculiae]SIR96345.1 NADH dehydrogenase subunit M [Williamsia sterculiae]